MSVGLIFTAPPDPADCAAAALAAAACSDAKAAAWLCCARVEYADAEALLCWDALAAFKESVALLLDNVAEVAAFVASLAALVACWVAIAACAVAVFAATPADSPSINRSQLPIPALVFTGVEPLEVWAILQMYTL